jgi:hypothetical protein
MLFAQNPALHHVLFAEGVPQRIPQRPNPWAYRWLSRAELADAAAMSACKVDSVVLIGAAPEDRARLEARGIRFTSPGFGRPSCARGTVRIQLGRAPVRVRLGFAETRTWAVDSMLESPGAMLEVSLPAGELDLLLCPADAGACLPGGRTLVQRRLTLAAGGSFQESVEAPRE